MNIDELMLVLEPVIKNPKVIITTIIIFLYIDIVCAIYKYRKKPKVVDPKKKRQQIAQLVENKDEEKKENEEDEE